MRKLTNSSKVFRLIERDGLLPVTKESLYATFEKKLRNQSLTLKDLFDLLNNNYKSAIDNDEIAETHTWFFDRWGCMYKQFAMHARFSNRRDDRLRRMEVEAATILRSLDDLISELVVLLTGKATSPLVGPHVGKNLRFVQILDAVGNFARHASEWQNVWLECHSFSPTQKRSIDPLVQLLVLQDTSSPMDDNYETFLSMSHPMLSILDELTRWNDADETSDFELLITMTYASATEIIDHLWPTFVARKARLSHRCDAIEAHREEVAQHSRDLWPHYVSSFQAYLNASLPPNFALRPVDIKNHPLSEWHWSSNSTFVCLMPNEDLTVSYWWGYNDDRYAASGKEAGLIEVEILQMSVEDMFEEEWPFMVDWLIRDGFDEDGQPAYAAGYTPFSFRNRDNSADVAVSLPHPV